MSKELVERLRSRAKEVDVYGDFAYPTLANLLRRALADDLREAADTLDLIRDFAERLPDGVWEVWTSNSYRRISRMGGGDGDVLRATVQRDGQPDLSWGEDECVALCDLVNGIRGAMGD